MVGEASCPPKDDVRGMLQALVLNQAGESSGAHAPPRIFALDKAFVLIDGHPPVNAPFFAVIGCSLLIPLTFAHSYRAVSLQQPARGDVSS